MSERRGTPIILVGGLWLDGSVWNEVVAELRRAGHRPVALTLPGQGDGRTDVGLADQLEAVLSAVDAEYDSSGSPVVLVGHSAASSLVWQAADRRIDQVARVVLIGGFPNQAGTSYADFFPAVDGAMPFPGWEAFEGPDSADLDEAARQRLLDAAIPVPDRVARGTVELADERRRTLPVTLVCPEFSPDEARAWVAAGDVPELAALSDLSYVDIDSGHWPMITRPRELAALLAETVG
ncbi:alpha/beta fold hydrolase [Jatrophihabitans sp.]|uniref:alpha/beta fold hydrolase n=1 Tax=Jatrophihabitans sp. TaxID=1932789 RepID=UPI002C3B39F7|nr:alpha/beta fold hydrolase [Jatrophihabitans sp.]